MLVPHRGDITVEGIVERLPDNLYLAAAFLLMMYVLKGLSVVFPIIVLQIAGGIIFPVWVALFINIIGTALTYTAPYLVGRFSGAGATERLINKYPAIKGAIMVQQNNVFFPAFILRAVSCLPGDIVSMYFGSIKAAFVPYVIASVVGTLPGLIPATTAGMSIMDPKSPVFIWSVIITVVTSVGSMVIYRLMKK